MGAIIHRLMNYRGRFALLLAGLGLLGWVYLCSIIMRRILLAIVG